MCSGKALAGDPSASLEDWQMLARTGKKFWFYNGRDRKKTGNFLRNGHFGLAGLAVSPCVVVCLKFIKTETFCNLLNFLYLSHISKMMVQMHLACYTGGIFLYDIRAHTYDLSNVLLGNK